MVLSSLFIRILIIVIVLFSGPLHILAVVIETNTKARWSDYGLQQSQDQIVAMYIVDATSARKYEVLKEIPLSEKESLIKNLNNLSFYETNTGTKYPNTSGIGFLIQYSDGGYDIVSSCHPCNCVIEDGELHCYGSLCYLNVYDHLFEQLIYEYSIK